VTPHRAREPIGAARELERFLVAGLDAICPRHLRDHVLELVRQAEGNEIGKAPHRQEEHAPAAPRHEVRALSIPRIRRDTHSIRASRLARACRTPTAAVYRNRPANSLPRRRRKVPCCQNKRQ
jgi:hypothetical protein